MSEKPYSTQTRRRAYGLIPAVLALGLGVGMSPATAAGSGATITREDVTGDTIVCGDETLTVISGSFQIVTREALTPSGAFHLIVEGNAQGVKAVSTSGASYQAPGGFWVAFNATPGATTNTSVGVLNVIGKGDAPDFRVRDIVHVTINANGVITAIVDFHSEATCIVD
ncbi:MAG: hypothetical protein ACRDPQ_11070 [Nocardioidaceae bacterium]